MAHSILYDSNFQLIRVVDVGAWLMQITRLNAGEHIRDKFYKESVESVY